MKKWTITLFAIKMNLSHKVFEYFYVHNETILIIPNIRMKGSENVMKYQHVHIQNRYTHMFVGIFGGIRPIVCM